VWKQLFDAADRRFGSTVNELARRDEVVALAALGLRSRTEIERAMERMSRRALHFLNLPAGSDVNRLLQQIARVEREVRGLRHQLADRENAEYLAALEADRDQKVVARSANLETPTPRKRTPRKPTPRKQVR
jgi:uncharacterized membrane protein YccC